MKYELICDSKLLLKKLINMYKIENFYHVQLLYPAVSLSELDLTWKEKSNSLPEILAVSRFIQNEESIAKMKRSSSQL